MPTGIPLHSVMASMMPALLQFTFERPEWLTPTVITVGFITALLIFILGIMWLARRPRQRSPRVTSDRRTAGRRQGNPVRIMIATDSEPPAPLCHGVVIDRSFGGLGLGVAQEVPAGTILQVRTLDALPAMPWARVEVTNIFKEEDRWRLGCVFVSMPPWDVLKLFG